MPQRFYKIIVACLLGIVFGKWANGQSFSRPQLHAWQRKDTLVRIQKAAVDTTFHLPEGIALQLDPMPLVPLPLAPSAYASQLGFFCRKEWQLEKRTRVPFRFRLGSKAYVDHLEGKRQ